MWIGVASQKNSLGRISAFSAFFLFWAFFRKWQRGETLKPSQLLADGLIFAMAVYLLRGSDASYSATSITIFLAGIVPLMLLYPLKNNIKPAATFMILAVGIGLLCLPFADFLVSTITSILGRNETFTDRTLIWNAVLEAASRSPFLGVGYGAFWGLQDAMIRLTLNVSEGHNGYLDVYLDVGIIGIIILFAFIIAHYRKMLKELNYAYDWGILGICFLIMILLYNFTESDILKPSSYFWNITILLTVVFTMRKTKTNNTDSN